MTVSAIPRPLDAGLTVAFAALGLFLPFSVAGVALALAVLALLAVTLAPAVWRTAPWREPVMAVGLLLLAYVGLHTLLTTGWTPAAGQTINRYHELLVAPVLFALFRLSPRRDIFFSSLVVGSVVYACVHWAAPFVPSAAAFVADRRISASFTLAVCSFVLLEQWRGKPGAWGWRAVAAFLAVTVLFATKGRTGQVVLLVLAAYAGWLHSPPRWRWSATLAAVSVVLAFAVTSPAVQERFGETLSGFTAPRANGVTSTSVRIELLRHNLQLAGEHFVLGAGYTRYGEILERQVKQHYAGQPDPNTELRDKLAETLNPHNEYVMQLVGGGVPALALFLAWLAAPMVRGGLSARRSPAVFGVAFAFAAGCLFNSMLLDFIEGHFYVALLAWMLARGDGTRPMKILLIVTRQIGDVLLTTPLLSAVRRRWPDARIDVLGFSGTLGMLRGNPDIDTLIETPHRLGFGELRRLVRRIWRGYQLAVVAEPSDRAHLIGWIAAPRRMGVVPEQGSSNWWKKALLDHAVHSAGDRGDMHVAAEKLSILDGAADPGVPVVVPPPRAALPPQLQAQLRPGAVVMHVPSVWNYKQWPVDRFRAVAAALLADGRQIVLTGTGGTRDQEAVQALLDLAPPPQLLDASGTLDLNQVTGLLEQAALYIGPDTSVSHLAAATGIPTIAIFGPTNPVRWGPWPKTAQARAIFERSALVQTAGNVTLLQGGLACVPCGRAGCEDHRDSRSDCLLAITPERVLEQARRLLRDPPQAPAGADQ